MDNDTQGVKWCNICCEMVNPMADGQNKCPICDTEFVEVMDNIRDENDVVDLRSAWVFSLYAPILLGLMGALGPSLSIVSRTSRIEEEAEHERENELILRRSTRTSTSPMHLFSGIHVRMMSESESLVSNPNIDNSLLMIDSFNEGALILRGPNENTPLNDFLGGSGFDFFLQHLAQNVPSVGFARVNPPAQKAAIEAMPSVISEEKCRCTVCLEDLDIGCEAREMPCNHKFHSDCITSWLKLHGSCPVCRFQMPSEDSTIKGNIENGNGGNSESVSNATII